MWQEQRRYPRFVYKEKLMRRSKYKETNAKENYIKTRISQLMDDMNKAHDQHDKNWYNRLIQELDWVQQVEKKPDHNCYMEKAGW